MGASAQARMPEPERTARASAGLLPEPIPATSSANSESATDVLRELALRNAVYMMEQAESPEGRIDLPQMAAGGIALHDVASDIESFGSQYELCVERGLPLPVVPIRGGSMLPINAHQLMFEFGAPRRTELVEESLYSLARDSPAIGLSKVQLADPTEVRKTFVARFANFLFARFRSTHSASEQSRNSIPGHLEFSVYAHRPGMRVHYHPAYWRDTSTVFGQPTSPATSYILPGLYMFGAVGRGCPLLFDDAEYEIPPQTFATLQIETFSW
jgi:hypothetical protein